MQDLMILFMMQHKINRDRPIDRVKSVVESFSFHFQDINTDIRSAAAKNSMFETTSVYVFDFYEKFGLKNLTINYLYSG